MDILRKWRYTGKWFIINAIGLSTAVACMLIIFLFVRQELSFDTFHSKSERIYRVTTDSNQGATSIHPARVAGEWTQKLLDEYPAIEKMVRLVPFRNAIVKIGEQKFYSQRAFATDSSFFNVFDFKIISGNSKTALSQPGRAFISRSMALKYFGHTDVTGREISILPQQDSTAKVYILDGVMEDFPKNSHFHAELLTSFTNDSERSSWAYTYYLMKEGTEVDPLRLAIQQKWEKEKNDESSVPILYLQKITDIHLFSQKTREIEANGNIRSIILLLSGAFIIFFIALVNFLNLSRVQFVAGIKSVKVKLINGASKGIIAREMALESLILSTFSLIAGCFTAYHMRDALGVSNVQSEHLSEIFWIIPGFMIVVALLAVLPLFSTRLISDMKVSKTKASWYTFPLVLQFSMAVLTIAGTLVLNRQMNFLNRQHPASQNEDMIVIADNPREPVERYDLFKSELLKNTAITGVTAAMEEPGGDILDAVGFEMEGIDVKEGQVINIFTADSNFFNMLGIQPLAGTVDLGFTPSHQWEVDAIELSVLRDNDQADKNKLSELEKKVENYREKYILNQSALAMLGISNPQEAIGKQFRLTFSIPDLFPEGEIVGVIPDFHYTNLHSKEKPLAIAPRKFFNYCFLISMETSQREKALTIIQSVWEKINPEFPLQYTFISDRYHNIYAGEYAQSRVLSLLALISIILSSLGIFTMSSFNIQCRTKEIGIRKVNGARIGEILTLLNRNFVKWIAIAFILATPVAWYAMHQWLQNFAYKTPLSWWIFAGSGALALGIALLTVSWQSWKAATRNPVEILKYE